PTFPVLLEALALYRTREMGRPVALFRAFAKSIIFQHYLDLFARRRAEAQGRPLGLVIPFDGFQGGLVVHNGTFPSRGFKWVFDVPGDAPPHRLTVEPFVAFLKHLAQGGWGPEAPLPRVRRTQRPRLRDGACLRPWMVHVLGCGPDALVLAHLLR